MGDKSASYWEGFQAFQTRKECRYPAESAQERIDWADGFAAAVDADRSGKVWWKSRTLLVCLMCFIIGVGLVIYGDHIPNSSGGMLMGAGGGLTVGSLISTVLRMVTREPIMWSGGGYGGGLPPYNN